MPKMDAVSSRNCAMMVQFPAAISCASLIASETKAKITATMKEVTAVRYSILRCFDIVMQIIVGLIGIRVEIHRGYEHRGS